MKSQSCDHPKSLSQARLEANRRNAKLSTGPGPEGKARSRMNALKHGLTARITWPGRDPIADQQFFARARARLGPRNVLEEIHVENLLHNRLREELFVLVERTVLNRTPPLAPGASANDVRYTFMSDATALKTLEQLARHITHFSCVTQKEITALLKFRQESWGSCEQDTSPAVEDSVHRPFEVPDRDPEQAASAANEDTLEACLADRLMIFPGENAQAFENLARELWATFQPINLLEEFIVVDYARAQWRLERVWRIERVVFERCAISGTGENCGFGFAFVHDAQRNQTLATLRIYEAALRRRLERLMTLWRKIRKEGWSDAVPSQTESSEAPSPSVDIAAESSTPSSAASTSGVISPLIRHAIPRPGRPPGPRTDLPPDTAPPEEDHSPS